MEILNITRFVKSDFLLGRRSRKTIESTPKPKETLVDFSENASLITYSEKSVERIKIAAKEDVLLDSPKSVSWFNLYGLTHSKEVEHIVRVNNLDGFISTLLEDTSHRTKVVELDGSFFFTAKSVHSSEDHALTLEQMMFVVSDDFVWSLQEKVGDHFDHIRERIEKNIGHVRQKGADYLLFLLLESIVDNYYETYEDLSENARAIHEAKWDEDIPNHLERIEVMKTKLFRLKRSLSNLREALHQIPNIDEDIIKEGSQKYFKELKEQTAYLSDLLENDLSRLESAANLFFSLQSHKLNEVMKTLTILSVVFIPLTFIAGIYGMNFDNMPELRTQNGYFIALGIMGIVALGSILYFRKRKWF